jgi:ABC-type transport system involved in multi-copper enzyme maturation permease subunit
LKLAARLLAGRRFWILPIVPVLWVGFQVFRLLVEWRTEDYLPADAQAVLIGTPLVVLAIGLGVRVMAGEIDQRTLEIAYTVPGGTHRVWLAKLTAAVAMLVGAELLLAAATFFFCTNYPPGALYGALQAAVFYLVLAMGLSALTKSEATGALLATGVLIFNFFIQAGNLRVSPFWNAAKLEDFDPADVLAWTTQNRVGFLLAIVAIMVLSFGRAERREKMLGG